MMYGLYRLIGKRKSSSGVITAPGWAFVQFAPNVLDFRKDILKESKGIFRISMGVVFKYDADPEEGVEERLEFQTMPQLATVVFRKGAGADCGRHLRRAKWLMDKFIRDVRMSNSLKAIRAMNEPKKKKLA